MAMCYKKLWKLLIDRDMTRADLRDKTGLSPATLAKMSKGERVLSGEGRSSATTVLTLSALNLMYANGGENSAKLLGCAGLKAA